VADAPYSHIPVFVRAGSIIPVGPEQEWSDQCAPELITLYVYTGADAEFTLYEDDGVSYDYEAGAQSTIRFSWNEGRQQLTIHDREGSFPGMLANRRFQIVLVNPDSATPMLPSPVNGKPIVEYSGKEITIFGGAEVKS
jgi:alpha-D-xyloside xylohydrolase